MRTVTVKSSGGDYTTLSAAENGEDGSLADDVTIECYALTDTTAVTFAGWTLNGFTVTVAAASGAGFNGSYTATNRYVLQTSANTVYSLNVANASAFVLTLRNIQLNRTGGAAFNFRVVVGNATANNGVEFDNCFAQVSTASPPPSGCYIVETDVSTNTLKARNTAFVGGVERVVLCNAGTMYLNNCTVNGVGGAAVIGVERVAGTCTVKNTAVFNCFDDFSGTITADFCASDDGDGTNAVTLGTSTEWDATWTDYVNNDYTVKDTSSLIYNVGTDLSGDANYPVTTDAKGTARPQAVIYDIGVDELISGAPFVSPPGDSTQFLMLLGVGT